MPNRRVRETKIKTGKRHEIHEILYGLDIRDDSKTECTQRFKDENAR